MSVWLTQISSHYLINNKKSDNYEIWTHAGEPIALAGQRLNHSAKLSIYNNLIQHNPF